MGGDFAPLNAVLGAIEASRHKDIKIYLFGDETAITGILNDKKVLTDATEGAKTVAVCLAIVESAKTGEKVKPNYEF